jgi:hypothetical protein
VERELYDDVIDPHQLMNLAATDPAVTGLHAWLEALRDCAGAGCREAEMAPP